MSLTPGALFLVITLGFIGGIAGLIGGGYVMYLLGSTTVEAPVTGFFVGATAAAWTTMRWLEGRKRRPQGPPEEAILRASFRRRYWATLVASAGALGTGGWFLHSSFGGGRRFFEGVGVPMLITFLIGAAVFLFVWRCPACHGVLGRERGSWKCTRCHRFFGEAD